jgi:SecD/SecF fusion protein
MFTALVVTRVLVDLITRIGAVATRPSLLGLNVGRRLRDWLEEHRPNLLKRIGLLLVIGGVVILISVAGTVARGFNFGIEFSGGRLLEFETTTTADLDQLREDLADVGFPRAVVQLSGQGNVIIRTEQLSESEEEAITAVVEDLTGESVLVRDQFVGPTLGAELRNKALCTGRRPRPPADLSGLSLSLDHGDRSRHRDVP